MFATRNRAKRRRFRFFKQALVSTFLAVLLVAMYSCIVSASNETEDLKPLRLLDTAGMNDFYDYNVLTGEVDYVPVTEYATPHSSNDEPRIIPGREPTPEVMANYYSEYYEDDFPEELDTDDLPEDFAVPYSIIGTDNRQAVSTITEKHVSTCLIVARYENREKDYCTGFMVDERHVLTAGHLVYNEHYGYATHFAVYAGSHAGKYKKYALGYRCRIGGDYIENCEGGNEKYELTLSPYFQKGMYDDWGIITCQTTDMGVGYMGMIATNSASSMLSYIYDTQGYPYDRNAAILGENKDLNSLIDYYMYWTSGKIQGDMWGPKYLDVVYMDLDVMWGQSGSPVYRWVPNVGYCVQAMVLGGNEDANFAILINDWLVDLIKNYL